MTDERTNFTERLELGGQAIIEGVMMRSREGYAMALRRHDGRILVRQVPFQGMGRRVPILKLPGIRGIVSLVEMLNIGTRALHWSADEFERGLRARQSGDAEAEVAAREPESGPGRESTIKKLHFLGIMATSVLLVTVLVVVAPSLLAWLVGYLPPFAAYADARGTMGFSEENHPIAYNLLSGLFRALILLGYIMLIARHDDVRRVFEYHGAEHKAVRTYEEEVEVTVKQAQGHSRLHPRCGTTFLAVVVLISIVAFAGASAALVSFVGGFPDWPLWQRKLAAFAAHAAVLPIVASVAFELMKFSARHASNPVCAVLLWPGYQLQKLTTRPPNDHQVEVAIVAMLAALAIRPTERKVREYVVRGLHDDPSAPGYVASEPAGRATT